MKSDFVSTRLHQQAIGAWLSKGFEFTHIATLTSNSSSISLTRMRDLIKEWDARVNRALYGPKWLAHHDELLFWFAFIEKPETNPHWHLLVRFQDPHKLERFLRDTERVWQKLLPSGTVDVQEITSRPERVAEYVAKRLGNELEYNHFVTPDEFRRI